MNDELKIRSILSRIEALHDEVESLVDRLVFIRGLCHR